MPPNREDRKTCDKCSGTGFIPDNEVSGAVWVCKICKGRGVLGEDIQPLAQISDEYQAVV